MALKPLYLSYTCNTIIAASLQSVLNYKYLPIMRVDLFRAKGHRGSREFEFVCLVEIFIFGWNLSMGGRSNESKVIW